MDFTLNDTEYRTGAPKLILRCADKSWKDMSDAELLQAVEEVKQELKRKFPHTHR